MRTCSSETAGHRWIWVAPIFGMLQWLKHMNWKSYSLPSDPNYGKSTSSVPTFNVSNEQLRSPGAICTSSVQANVAKEPGTLSQNSIWWCGLFGAFVCDEHPADSSNMFLGQAKQSETQWNPQIWAVDLEHICYTSIGKNARVQVWDRKWQLNYPEA